MLFEKAIVFTDLHIGLKNNSIEHNENCFKFIEWIVEKGKELDIKTACFLGDWFDSRQSINVSSLHYSLKAMQILNDNFDEVYFIVGNHDMYYKHNRDVYSVEIGKLYPNFKVIDKPFIKDEVAFYPWLVEDEWKKVKSKKVKYVFGHFELPTFLLNAMIEMPDHGELSKDHFKNSTYVFSGHFHKRQNKDNVHYIGNCFPHNFADVNDDDRGCMIFGWDKEPEYINWKGCPKYRKFKLEDLYDNAEEYLTSVNYYIRAEYSTISHLEAIEKRDELLQKYDIKELAISEKKRILTESDENEETTEDGELVEGTITSIDAEVLTLISKMDTEEYDKKLLAEIYNN